METTQPTHQGRGIFARWVGQEYESVLSKISTYIFLSLGVLIPLWFLSYSGNIDFSREVTFGILISLAFGIWLLRVLLKGEVSYVKSPINIALLVFLAIAGLSTILSKIPYVAFFSSDVVSERLINLIFYALAYWVASSALTEKKDAVLFMFLLIGAGAVSAIITLLGFFGVHILPFPFANRIDFNIIGTVNGLALFYGFLLVVVSGFLVTMRNMMDSMPQWMRVGLWGSAVLFLLNLIVVNFFNAWLSIFVSFLVILWLYVRESMKEEDRHTTFKNFYFYLIAGGLGLSLLFMFVRTPLFPSIQFSAEVSPSLLATVNIGFKTLSQSTTNLFVGSGPGTFAYDYSLFKDPAINQTVVWGVRFGQGYSFMSTVLSTLGFLGILSLLALVGISLITIFRNVARHESKHTLVSGLVAGCAFLLLGWFIYPENFTLSLLAFIVLGILMSILHRDDAPVWGIKDHSLSFKTPWMTFGFSLVTVFLIALSVAGIYVEGKRYVAASRFQDAVTTLQQTGNVDNAIQGIKSSTSLDPVNDQYQRFLAQAYLLKTQNIISASLQKAPSPETQAEFRDTVNSAVGMMQAAIQLNKIESFNWRTAGSVYETLIPLVPGADQSAVNAYTEASSLDPSNPTSYVDLGRTHMIISDTAQGLLNQRGTTPEQAKQYSTIRTSNLNDATQFLQRATQLKPDFATSQFLLAQVALRTGNIDLAIASTESASISAPNDIGVAFQLGLLYYQKQNYDKAQEAFLRAVALNDNYSNARYFLGLILDQKGQHDEAVRNFEKIQALNPDNQEVKHILQNLRAGKPALTDITPPPEKRSDTPVKDEEGKENTPINKKK